GNVLGAGVALRGFATFNSKLYVTDVLTSKVFVSTDGSNWQLSNNGFNVGAAPLAITVFNGRLYVGETLNPGRVYVSTDGNSWYPPQGGFGVTGNSNGIQSLAVLNGRIYAGDSRGKIYY